MAKKCDKYFREDLERVNEEFHEEDGTVSYETKKVPIHIHYIHYSYETKMQFLSSSKHKFHIYRLFIHFGAMRGESVMYNISHT